MPLKYDGQKLIKEVLPKIQRTSYGLVWPEQQNHAQHLPSRLLLNTTTDSHKESCSQECIKDSWDKCFNPSDLNGKSCSQKTLSLKKTDFHRRFGVHIPMRFDIQQIMQTLPKHTIMLSQSVIGPRMKTTAFEQNMTCEVSYVRIKKQRRHKNRDIRTSSNINITLGKSSTVFQAKTNAINACMCVCA